MGKHHFSCEKALNIKKKKIESLGLGWVSIIEIWIRFSDVLSKWIRFFCDTTELINKVNIYLPWFQRFIFIIFIAKGRGKINLWLKAAIDSSSRANQFELGSDPDSVS